MVSRDLYHYDKLDPLRNTARLVSILPGDPTSPMQCVIRVMNLESPPPYCALSYVWGSCLEKYNILVDEAEMSVTQNLYVAMQHLRSHVKTGMFWIDAICINQLDFAEKGLQVQQMQKIYGRAMEVLIWLGPEQDQSGSAIALASTIAAYWSGRDFVLRDEESEFLRNNQADLSELLDICNCKVEPAPVEAFRLIMARSWFERVWTVQEAAAPVQIKTFQCGDSKISWQGFILAAKFLSHVVIRPDLKEYFSNAAPLTTISMRGLLNLDHVQKSIGIGQYETDLLGTLANYRHYKATDPKDKVYALLGLVMETSAKDWVCDYSLDLPTIYFKVAEHCVLKGHSLEFLAYCNLSSQQAGLPSWVPDWRSPGPSHPFAHRSKHRSDTGVTKLAAKPIYCSNGNLPMPRNVHLPFPVLRGRELVAEGFCVDSVNSIGVAFNNPNTISESESDILSGWEPENLHCTYGPTGETILEAFSRTIVADVAKQGRLRKRGYVIDWLFWRSVKDYTKPPPSAQRRVEWGSLLFAAVGRSFVLSNEGYLCLAPGTTRPGDQICFLFGGSIFYLLRPAGKCWSFLGECYVHGFMDGEAMSLLSNGHLELQQFTIV